MGLVLPKATRKRLASGNYAFYENAEIIGMVKWTTEGTSIFSALSKQPGPRMWYPTDKNGIALVPGLTFKTLKEASRVLLKILAPVQAKVSVEIDTGLLSGSLYWEGHTLWVSRWPGEEYWMIDGYIAVGGFCPQYNHGTGTRPGSGRAIADEECIKVLDEAALKL